jgi:hypothetical protein
MANSSYHIFRNAGKLLCSKWFSLIIGCGLFWKLTNGVPTNVHHQSELEPSMSISEAEPLRQPEDNPTRPRPPTSHNHPPDSSNVVNLPRGAVGKLLSLVEPFEGADCTSGLSTDFCGLLEISNIERAALNSSLIRAIQSVIDYELLNGRVSKREGGLFLTFGNAALPRNVEDFKQEFESLLTNKGISAITSSAALSILLERASLTDWGAGECEIRIRPNSQMCCVYSTGQDPKLLKAFSNKDTSPNSQRWRPLWNQVNARVKTLEAKVSAP